MLFGEEMSQMTNSLSRSLSSATPSCGSLLSYQENVKYQMEFAGKKADKIEFFSFKKQSGSL